jgi:hypothetical protein
MGDLEKELYAALDDVMREIVGERFKGSTETEREIVQAAWDVLERARQEQ